MTSVLQDLVREYQAAMIGFGQVFLISGILVAIAYGLKARLMPQKARLATGKSFKAKTRTSPAKPSRSLKSERQPAPPEPKVATSDCKAEAPMSPEAHWERAIAPIRLGVARSERARELHDRAAIRLDSADYAFRQLLVELAEVLGPVDEPELSQPVFFTPEYREPRKLAA